MECLYDLKTTLVERKNSAEDWNTSQLLAEIIKNLSTRQELEGQKNDVIVDFF